MMMNKLFAILLSAVLALSCTAAFAATYRYEDDIAFAYDKAQFEVTMDDHTDDEDLIILDGREAAWGNVFVRIHVADLRDNETFPTLDDFVDMGDTEVTQGDWNGYENVFMYTLDQGDSTDSFFIAPVLDDDGEVDAILTVEIGIDKIDDEEAAMDRDDGISEILGTLKIED